MERGRDQRRGHGEGDAEPWERRDAEHPALQVLADAATGVGIAACVAAAFAAWRRPLARVLALLAVAYVVLVAVATFAGYAGNPRYLVPAIAVSRCSRASAPRRSRGRASASRRCSC